MSVLNLKKEATQWWDFLVDYNIMIIKVYYHTSMQQQKQLISILIIIIWLNNNFDDMLYGMKY